MKCYPSSVEQRDVRGQIERYYLLYKPTSKYLHASFWATEDARVVAAMVAKGRITRARDADELLRRLELEASRQRLTGLREELTGQRERVGSS